QPSYQPDVEARVCHQHRKTHATVVTGELNPSDERVLHTGQRLQLSLNAGHGDVFATEPVAVATALDEVEEAVTIFAQHVERAEVGVPGFERAAHEPRLTRLLVYVTVVHANAALPGAHHE